MTEGFAHHVVPHSGGEARSDEEGQFWAIPPASKVFLRAAAEGYASAWLGPLEVDMALGLADLDVQLTRGGSIEGKLRSPLGRAVANKVIGATRGDGFVISTRTDEAGSYRLANLAPGAWQVRASATDYDPVRPVLSYSLESRAGELPMDVFVVEGGVSHFDCFH